MGDGDFGPLIEQLGDWEIYEGVAVYVPWAYREPYNRVELFGEPDGPAHR